MQEIINKIVQQNKSLFGDNPIVKEINVGFTNTLYTVNDSFIIKICTDFNNEPKFNKEIEFYNTNKDNDLIAKLYYANTDKIDIPYYYEILEKINGISLYDVWHTFNEEQREDIIKQLCKAMKQFHSNKGQSYDWIKRTSDLFISSYSKAKELNLFTNEEQELLEKAYSKFGQYLHSNEFVLVHNDLHFDNVFYDNGKIKLIDFERSIYAPRDFELDILYRMVR